MRLEMLPSPSTKRTSQGCSDKRDDADPGRAFVSAFSRCRKIIAARLSNRLPMTPTSGIDPAFPVDPRSLRQTGLRVQFPREHIRALGQALPRGREPFNFPKEGRPPTPREGDRAPGGKFSWLACAGKGTLWIGSGTTGNPTSAARRGGG